MIVVSGCPRSGTSSMMLCLREMLGEERILGAKFPQDEAVEAWRVKLDSETEHQYNLRIYLYEKRAKDNDFKDLNPGGFWECQYSVRGIAYNFSDRVNLRKYEDETKETVVKIVSQGLLSSDPQFINQIIYMVRHPRQVAKSQERLRRGFEVDGNNMFEGHKIHTPEMFIKVTGSACLFLVENPTIPVELVNFDDLISDSKGTLQRVADFIGEDLNKADSMIKPSLNRSAPEDIDHALWEDAEKVYDLFSNKDFQGVIDYLADLSRETNKEANRWHCPRTGQTMSRNQCSTCTTNETVRTNFRKTADIRKIDWQNEPCPYECGMNPNVESISIEQSIAKNFWRD